MKEHVDLNMISRSPHTSAIITGLVLLEKEGLIDLSVNLCYDRLSSYPHPHMVEIKISDKMIAFDLLDGYNWDLNRVEAYLNNVDFYFKRSFSKEKNLMISEKNRCKLNPLGFNYHVTCPGNPIDISDHCSLKDYLKRLLGVKPSTYFVPSVFEASPKYKKDNLKILFFTRLWEINESQTAEFNGEIEYINNMRIQIIRELRKLYPHNFIGGIQLSDLAKQCCNDLIMSRRYTIRNNYLKLMKLSDICIGSMGLHESIGWKTGEYVAASRAIVNEKFHYDVVGPFEEGRYYLSFGTVKECVGHVTYLMEHPEVVYAMQQENEKYYNEYLKPDKLVLNAINKAFGRSE